MIGSIHTLGFPGLLASTHDATSGTCPDQAGSGDSTVRAQIHAIGVSLSPSGPIASGYRCPILRSASSRIHCPYASASAAIPCALSHVVRAVSISG